MKTYNSMPYATPAPPDPRRPPSSLPLRRAGQHGPVPRRTRAAQNSSVKGDSMRPPKTIGAVLAARRQAAASSSFPAPTSPKTSGSSGALTSPSTMLKEGLRS
jgi:hypothetical protein